MTDYLDELISSLTLQEKAALCTGAGPWTTTPIDRLGVPPLMVADGPHGIRRVADLGSMTQVSMPATCFPTASCSASTWNTDLIRAMGEAIAEEAIALGVDVVLGPGVNIKRSPLGGRNFEYFSEDPYLAGAMATNFIRGVQSKGVGTSLKHYAANNQEFQRFSISAEIDERTLREIYLAAFEMAVREARPWTVMCSYNKVNGVFAAEHHDLLTRILRGEWGFEGFVVSDWGAVRDRVASLRAGLDLEMPGPQPRHVQSVVDAVNDGRLPESLLVEAVRRILRIVNAAQQTPKGGAFDADAHHALARKIAAEGMVLLKNDGLLPLRNGQRIAVIGRSAQMAYYQGGGSSHINPPRVDVPFVELGLRAPQSKLGYAEGYPGDDVFRQDMIDEAVALAREADVAVLLLALPAYKESEGYDRQDLDLTAQQVALVRAVAVAQPRAVVVLNNGAPVSMSEWIAHVPAVLEGWMMGQAGGGAIADILFGLTNPSGKLTETFPLRLIDTPAHLNWPGGAGKVNYGEGLYLGYRYYDARDMPVQFPFGHGLSYTTFAYSNPQVSAVSFRDVDGVTVTVDVTNTGPVAGKEIVQFYVHDVASGLVRPEKELKGFAKVALAPGATETVGVELDFRSFAYFHPEYGQWIAEEGDFDILIGSSAARIHHTLRVTLQATRELPCVLDDESTIREWIADPRGQAVLGPMFARMEENSRRMFEGNEGGPGLGMSFMEMLGDMPLVSVLMWQQDMLPLHPEEVVAGLLAQVHDRK